MIPELLKNRLDIVEDVLADRNWFKRWQAELLYEITYGRIELRYVVEFGSFHGAGACYMGALAEHYGGRVVTVDVGRQEERVEDVVAACGLSNVEVIVRPDGSFGWGHDRLAYGPEVPPIDLIYVDADHRWHAVCADLSIAYAAVRPGGLILFDDIENAGCPYPGKLFDRIVPHFGGEWERRGNWGLLWRPAAP